MIRNLLTAEAHRDPYVWAAVLLAHFAIGSMLWLVIGIWAISVYAAFEVMQALCSGFALWWDSVLDWCGVALGVVFIDCVWAHNVVYAGLCVISIACITFVGCVCRRQPL